MQTLIDLLKDQIQSVAPVASEVEVTASTAANFGHYQCNSAMKWARELKRSPRDIAQEIVSKMPLEWFSKVEVAGPGFINFTFSPEFLTLRLNEQIKEAHFGVQLPSKKERIVVDFSSPNIAKEMHVGHLRSTIIGDCLARIFEFLGHDVLRLNHVGDWGTAFGMLIAYMKETHQSPQDLPTLMSWYRASKEKFDADEAFKIRSRQAVVALQAGDPEALRLWKIICDISQKAFEEVYSLLDVKLTLRGESFYNPLLQETLDELKDKGLTTLSEGALCVFHEGIDIPFMVQKSDGGFNYDTTDIAAMRHRVLQERADRIIIVTDAGQSLHFQLLKLTAEKAGYLKNVRFDHVPFGLVLGADGKKFRTRSGDVEKLIDLLQAAVEMASQLLKQKDPTLSDEEIKSLGQVLGMDAVKYADLSCNRTQDYLFSYERMLRFDGNTAAFILYAYVRIAGIKRKIKEPVQAAPINLQHPSEIELGLHLLRFNEVITTLTETLTPHLLTDYLYELAVKFNAFFRDCRVEGSDLMAQRLSLCEATAELMALGLHLLGLKTVEKM
jgi:arginyl-tRNA synthetase